MRGSVDERRVLVAGKKHRGQYAAGPHGDDETGGAAEEREEDRLR